MRRKAWFIIAVLVLVVGVGYAAYLLFSHKGADSLTVSELRSQAEFLDDQQIRVEGKVTPGSIDWDDKTRVIRFVLTDDKESLRIVYRGIVPDDFRPGGELVVEGRHRPDGVFEALSFSSRRSLCSFCH